MRPRHFGACKPANPDGPAASSPVPDTKRIKAVGQFTMQDVLTFREGWTFQPVTALKQFERRRSFFRFVKNCGWIKTNPCEQVKPPKVDQAPTLPFTDEEYKKLVRACDQLPDNCGEVV